MNSKRLRKTTLKCKIMGYFYFYLEIRGIDVNNILHTKKAILIFI